MLLSINILLSGNIPDICSLQITSPSNMTSINLIRHRLFYNDQMLVFSRCRAEYNIKTGHQFTGQSCEVGNESSDSIKL
jgi:hypothetical protein